MWSGEKASGRVELGEKTCRIEKESTVAVRYGQSILEPFHSSRRWRYAVFSHFPSDIIGRHMCRLFHVQEKVELTAGGDAVLLN